ncbi:MAG: hypothetical protein OIF40_05160 [Mangrovicoccus sp.]|nr:hypothetical protein [Mangrovicoccus sp.]
MFDAYPDGKIEANSEQFAEMHRIAKSRLAAINSMPGAGLGSKFRRHLALSKLNAQLSFYGWAIRRDGTLFEVRVRGEPVKLCRDDRSQLPPGSCSIRQPVAVCQIPNGIALVSFSTNGPYRT